MSFESRHGESSMQWGARCTEHMLFMMESREHVFRASVGTSYFFIYFLLFPYLLFFLLFSKFFAYFQLFINSLYILRILPLPIFYILSSFFLSSIFSVLIVYFWQKEILILVEQKLKFLN